MNSSKPNTIKIVTALSLVFIMLLSLLFMSSCSSDGKSSKNGNVKHGKELKESAESISEDEKGEYCTLVDKYIGYLNGDYDGIQGLFPEEYWKSAPMSEDVFINNMKGISAQTDASNVAQYGTGYEFYYSIDKEQNLTESIDEVQNNLSDKYGISGDRVTASYYLLVTVYVKSDTVPDGRQVYDKVFRPVVIDGKWYLADELVNFGIISFN